jgi:hypothetical protein
VLLKAYHIVSKIVKIMYILLCIDLPGLFLYLRLCFFFISIILNRMLYYFLAFSLLVICVASVITFYV